MAAAEGEDDVPTFLGEEKAQELLILSPEMPSWWCPKASKVGLCDVNHTSFVVIVSALHARAPNERPHPDPGAPCLGVRPNRPA